jgi:argininosuccinate lyase
MKLWEKGILTDKLIEQFTVGKDRELDLLLARYDVLGSMAHVIMLGSVGLLTKSEQDALHKELLVIYEIIGNGGFVIGEDVEDVHSQVELMLTQKLGDAGKRIHTARSRNDQVLLDIKLFTREELHQVVTRTVKLFDLLIAQGERYKHILMPGYTHLQVAMPSSFGLWFGAYAESLTDDMQMMLAAYRVANQNPLGSAAGYGSSFPVNREQTTNLLGFDSMHYNVVNAQMSRGKTERSVAFALSSLAGTISKMAFDVCLFSSQNFGFVVLPDEITTGSSIMPHKKNPDVFELLRARCNKIQALPAGIDHVIMNLPSGYFRDMQIIKESFLPVFGEVKDCLAMATFAMEKIKPVDNLLDDERYRYITSVDEVNRLVMNGIPFREAYADIAGQIREGTYNPGRHMQHTHEGSIGNLCNDKIVLKMKAILEQFNFQKKDEACRLLLKK